MTNKEILQADLLDIIFENRNKDYGAYALRKKYNCQLQWALGISLTSAFLVVMIRSGNENSDGQTSGRKAEVTLSPLEIPKPETVEMHRFKKSTNVAQVKNTRINIVPDDRVKRPEVPTPGALLPALTSTEYRNGISPDSSTVLSSSTNTSEGNGNPKSLSPSSILLVSSEAEFPGGQEAFKKFLSRYLVTPGDLEPGEKKIVLVRFMVDARGVISKTEILQSDADQYSREVLRVLNKMPNWSPAIQNGAKVATWFTQPVTFIGSEQ